MNIAERTNIVEGSSCVEIPGRLCSNSRNRTNEKEIFYKSVTTHSSYAPLRWRYCRSVYPRSGLEESTVSENSSGDAQQLGDGVDYYQKATMTNEEELNDEGSP